MYTQIIISMFVNLLAYSNSKYLREEANYSKQKLERNNVLNKGLWMKEKVEKSNYGDFIFRTNSADVDSLLQNNFDAFGQNYMDTAPIFSSYIERNKRSTIRKQNQRIRNNLKKCKDSTCLNDATSLYKSKFLSKLKPAFVFKEYPYELALLLTTNNKREVSNTNKTYSDVGSKNQSQKFISENDSTTMLNEENKTDLNPLSKKESTNGSTIIIPKRSMTYPELLKAEASKNIELVETTQTNTKHIDGTKINRNVFDKEDRIWQSAPSQNIAYNVIPRPENVAKNKPVTEKGLAKVLSLLTKTFRKIMKQHNEIQEIDNKLHGLNEDFMKNVVTLERKFQEFDIKYALLLKLNDELKITNEKFTKKIEHSELKEMEMSKNLIEFENQQKKFLAQQRQFYAIQKIMLEQNEKINLKQTLIAKTQSEISHRQNNFARVLKKAKQLYVDTKVPKGSILGSFFLKPNNTSKTKTQESEKIILTTPIPTVTTNSIKINLFSIPKKGPLETAINLDKSILDEKDDQPIDDLVYKYYFNNTHITDLMRSNVLTAVMNDESKDTRNLKTKRNELINEDTTILLPVLNKKGDLSLDKNLRRQRRWIRHSKKTSKKFHGKDEGSKRAAEILKETKVKEEVESKTDPFLTMATNFCIAVRQNLNTQMLNWCIEKSLRRLKSIDMKTPMKSVVASLPLNRIPEKVIRNKINGIPTEATTVLVPKEESTVDAEQSLTTAFPPSRTDGIKNPYGSDLTTESTLSLFFPDNDELELNLKQFDLKPDTEGTVYFDGSLHTSDIVLSESEALSDIMPGLDSNSHVDVDPLALDLQARRRAYVRRGLKYALLISWNACDLVYATRYPASSMPLAPDVAFYRILCITLIVVAVTFTVIITSIFVDIDGLLVRQSSQTIKKQPPDFKPVPLEEYQDFPSSEDIHDESEPSFRVKRSVESNDIIYKIKSLKLKKILTKHLATLLDELDEDETLHATEINRLSINTNRYNEIKPNYVSRKETDRKIEANENVEEGNDENFIRSDEKTDLLHLVMHNILLQGIVEHRDLSEVYKKVHLLIKKLDNPKEHNFEEFKKKNYKNKSTELVNIIFRNAYNEENKFYNELLKCQELQKQISDIKQANDERKRPKDSPFFIKAVIEVTDNEKRKENITNSSKHVEGLIKMLYNGLPMKIEEMTDYKENQLETTQKVKNNGKHNNSITSQLDTKNKQNNVFDHAISEYLRTHSIKLQNNDNLLTKASFETKRLKRQIKIHYGNEKNISEKSKKLNKNHKNHKDELYVEIETHFDGRGTKGEKKKKLVRSLIDKIQKAINSNIEDAEKNNTEKTLPIKKRTQNPIDNKEQIATSNLRPVNTVQQRLLNPITKTANMIQPLKSVLDKYGEEWKKQYYGPGFLTLAKSLNSAEMNELDIDYNGVMENGIPKRLQMPLNTENSEIFKPNEAAGTKNVRLYLKEIDGSGFTIGINQYADEPPDKESLQMFTGLENLIKTYHERYDQEDMVNLDSSERTDYIDGNQHDIMREYANRQKRSAMRVKLFSNLKSKTNLNKFLNTHAMQTKKIFLKNKRNKRHIDKIRIVASDHYLRPEDQNIFLVSHEDIFADRAVLKDQHKPKFEVGDRNDEHYDYIAPYDDSDNIPQLIPYISSAYDTKTLQTRLMSQYPHIFEENISKSKEEYLNNNPINHKILENKFRKFESEAIVDAGDTDSEKNTSVPNVEEIVNAVLPKTNYKLTVKILPKNKSGVNPGYKEVHTTINKSYDRNGLRYVSSVNVSEISKFESSNKSNEEIGSIKDTQKYTVVNDDIEKERNKIKLLLKLHKAGIDRQLEFLKIESQKIRGMIGNEDRENIVKNMSHIVDVLRQLGPMILDEKGIVHSNEYRPSINETTTLKAVPKNSRTTMEPFTIENKQDDLIKAELLKTIKQNENITRQILQKIDNNTNILQSFLQKLFDKLQPTQVNIETENLLRNNKTVFPKHSEAIIPIFDELYRNFSKSIPFIYAFQHPIVKNKDKSFKSVANVVYHGHIHANEADNYGKRGDFFKDIAKSFKIKNSNTQKGSTNETRFFIDDLENDFKLIPNVNRHQNVNTTENTKSN